MKLARVLLVGFVAVPLGCDPEPKDAPQPEAKPVAKAKPEAKAEPQPIVIRQADTIAPSELGIDKYVFEEKVPAGKVMVLRLTEWRNGRKQKGPYETIQYTNGGLARQVVLVYDLGAFPFSIEKTQEIRVKHPGHSLRHFPEFRWRGSMTKPGVLNLEFGDFKEKSAQMRFECFVEDHKAAKARVPELPAASPIETWTYQIEFDDE